MMKKIKKITVEMLLSLPERSRDIITRRYGLKKDTKCETLDSIGKTYGITRERVRQIESVAKKLLKKSNIYEKDAVDIVKKIKEKLEEFGGILKKDDFFDNILVVKDKENHNHIYFIIDITDEMDLENATKDFYDLIYTKKEKKDVVQNSIISLYKKIGTDEILSEQDIISKFLEKIENELKNDEYKKVILKKYLKENTLKRILKITKKISSNELGGWGRVDSRNIVTKGIKDLAYLVLREKKKPLHFKEIVREVYKKFNKEINSATCHNELIRDERFILIGRGIYGLSEWGVFDGGTVIEVIEKILKNAKEPLTKKDIIEKVLEKKQVKEQTIAINLSKKTKFKKNTNGKYELI